MRLEQFGFSLTLKLFPLCSLLRAVSLLLDIRVGRQVHCGSLVSGLSLDVNVVTGLV